MFLYPRQKFTSTLDSKVTLMLSCALLGNTVLQEKGGTYNFWIILSFSFSSCSLKSQMIVSSFERKGRYWTNLSKQEVFWETSRWLCKLVFVYLLHPCCWFLSWNLKDTVRKVSCNRVSSPKSDFGHIVVCVVVSGLFI